MEGRFRKLTDTWICAYCETPNERKDKRCVHCDAPRKKRNKDNAKWVVDKDQLRTVLM